MSDMDTPEPPQGKVKRSYGSARPKVPPFARFEGTSAWRNDHRRAREYARFRAAMQAKYAAPSPGV